MAKSEIVNSHKLVRGSMVILRMGRSIGSSWPWAQSILSQPGFKISHRSPSIGARLESFASLPSLHHHSLWEHLPST
jgi:hypothetical protein